MSKKKIAELNEKILFEFAKAEKGQQSQIFEAQQEAQEIRDKLDTLDKLQAYNLAKGDEILSQLEQIVNSIENQELSSKELGSIDSYFNDYQESIQSISTSEKYDIRKTKEIITNDDWDSYYDRIIDYSKKLGIDDNEDPFLSLLGEQEYIKLEKEINDDFSKKTSINNKNDLKFLAIAIALEVTKGLLVPIITGKLGYGDSFNPEERLKHDDKSIENAHKNANKNFLEKNKKNYSSGKWEKFISQPVPYDITAGSANIPGLNLHGSLHRLYTLGHDQILGWIFGTANIMTDVITVSQTNNDLNSKGNFLVKMAGIKSYKIQRNPNMMILPKQISSAKMFKDSYDIARENQLNLPAAVFTEAQHLKSDINTKMGLPVPLLETFSPDFASKLYTNKYDALCFARDIKIVGTSATVSLMIDMLISLIHGLYYNPDTDISKDLYEVRTRKILLVANAIGTSSNLILSFCTKNIKNIDLGGLLIAISHLFTDPRFILNIKKEFVENKIYEKISTEIEELEKIENGLIQYSENHRYLYN